MVTIVTGDATSSCSDTVRFVKFIIIVFQFKQNWPFTFSSAGKIDITNMITATQPVRLIEYSLKKYPSNLFILFTLPHKTHYHPLKPMTY